MSSLTSTDGSPSKAALLVDLQVIPPTQVGVTARKETKNWVTLKEGYLFKTKRVKKSFHAVKSCVLLRHRQQLPIHSLLAPFII